jgi:hypothetical protein
VAKKKNELIAEREAKLNAIGLVCKVRYNPDWNLRFQQLVEYKQAVGHCNVPERYRANPQLVGLWVQ